MQYESTDDIAIEASECHILTFGEKAIKLGQSVNYVLGSDIGLHILVHPELSSIVVNNCIADVWQEQSLIYVPKAEQSALRVAVLFRKAEIVVALLGGHASTRAAEPMIGSNPERRFSSASSRSLATADRHQGRSAR